MVLPQRDREKYWLGVGDPWSSSPATSDSPKKKAGRTKKVAPKPKASGLKAKPSTRGRKLPTRSTRSKKVVVESDEEEEEEEEPVEEKTKDVATVPEPDLPPHQKTTFPVVLTTYEIVMKDRPELSMYKWGFVVVDEGHRLKNMECRLMRELKALPAVGRMVLTGTPLHVSLIFLYAGYMRS